MHRYLVFLILSILVSFGAASCGDDDKPVQPDTTPPTVTLLAPANGSEIVGPRSLPFQARATDDTGVARVDFLFDGVVVGRDSSGTGDLYDFTWQNPPLSAGQHHATARAFDAVGNSSDEVATITISAAPDTTPPVVTLLEPVDGREMSGPRSLPFQARATDDFGVTRVDFLFDGEVVGRDSSGTGDIYDYTWQNPPIAVGQHQATARAHDAAGHSSDAVATITIIAR